MENKITFVIPVASCVRQGAAFERSGDDVPGRSGCWRSGVWYGV
jgi:hypothetical protein